MKELLLDEVLNSFRANRISGTKKLSINKVVTRPYYIDQNNTLYFERSKRRFDALELKKYSSCVVVSEDIEHFKEIEDCYTLVEVKDIEQAYFGFVKYYRGLFNLPVIAVTGTCGKTTTKEMIKHILSEHYQVQSTYRSKNASRLNLPYLMGIEENTQTAVFETGVADPGDLLDSCMYFAPNIGIITNIGVDHIQGCGTLEGYIKAKGEMLEGLNYQGTLILNGDDENIKKLPLRRYRGQLIYFGQGEDCQFRVSNIRYGSGGMNFTLHYFNLPHELFVPGYGEFNVYNALAALAAVHTLGFGIKEAGQRLISFKHVYSHFEVFPGINGCTVIDDTWNSNPTSVETSLKALKGLAAGDKALAVIGKMSQLGEYESEFHIKVGKIVAQTGINTLVTIGETAKFIAQGAQAAGMSKTDIYICKDSKEAYEIITKLLDKNTVVLLKTKSSMSGPEEILVDKLKN